jgi:hypothetical protein
MALQAQTSSSQAGHDPACTWRVYPDNFSSEVRPTRSPISVQRDTGDIMDTIDYYQPSTNPLKVARESMAFRGPLLSWLEGLIRVPGAGPQHASVDVQDVGALPVGTTLHFRVAHGDKETMLRFDQACIPCTDDPTEVTCQVRRVGEQAIILVTHDDGVHTPAVTLCVEASRDPHLDAQAANPLIDFTSPTEPRTGPAGRHRHITIWLFKAIQPAPMVGWYDPIQLLRTGLQVFISTVFGQHADYRLIEALAPGSDDWYDYSQPYRLNPDGTEVVDEHAPPRTELWLDYAGDVGDGWDATYAVAYYLAQPSLVLKYTQGDDIAYATQRGDVLVFGGDQVYPMADRQGYEARLVQPYETALRFTTYPYPHVFGIPGNHDWYDSLVAFTRLFCSQRWFGGWRTRQARSYFALKLPHRWWLLGVDVQLGSDIDVPQVNYFKHIAEQMEPDSLVILCTAEPHWVYTQIYGQDPAHYNESNLTFLEKKVLGDKAKVVVFLAGDQHHYRRYTAADGTHKITAGGGGAFLHPTHAPNPDHLDDGFTLERSFPTADVSRALTWHNLWFPRLNFKFGLVLGVFYLLTAWAFLSDIGQYGLRDIGLALRTVIHDGMTRPVAAFWVVAMVCGFVLYTDGHPPKTFRWMAGPLHAVMHVVAVFGLSWGATYVSVTGLGLAFTSVPQLVLTGGLIVVSGVIVGSLLMGLYLALSLNVFHRHWNEAFSALKIPHWKHFLRLRIDDQSDLTIFAVAIERVPQMWAKSKTAATGMTFIPHDPKATAPVLIERVPVRNPRRGGQP